MIQNRNMSRAARKRTYTHIMDPVVADFQAGGFIDVENDIKILRVDIVFLIASGASEDAIVEIGTVADPNLYVSYTVADSQAIGVVVNATLLVSTILAKNTPLIIQKDSASADTDATAKLAVTVTYVIVDDANEGVTIP